MAGCADDQSFAAIGAQLRDRAGGIVKTEVDHDIAMVDDGFDVVAQIDFGGDLQIGKSRGASDQCLAHAALRTGDTNARHII
jgi:hypothetical protein